MHPLVEDPSLHQLHHYAGKIKQYICSNSGINL
jgi:hypothetical protein